MAKALFDLIKSTRFRIAVINSLVLAGCELYYQLSGNKVSLEFQGLITATLMSLIGADTMRKLGQPKEPVQ